MPIPSPPGQLSLFAVDSVPGPRDPPVPAPERTAKPATGNPGHIPAGRTDGSGALPSHVATDARFLAFTFGTNRRPPQEHLADAERRFVVRLGAEPALIAVCPGEYERYGPLDGRVIPLAHLPAGGLYLLLPPDAPRE